MKHRSRTGGRTRIHPTACLMSDATARLILSVIKHPTEKDWTAWSRQQNAVPRLLLHRTGGICRTSKKNTACLVLGSATKMNPNLRYAQAIPGRNNGRGAGIIETSQFPELIDAVGMLNGSKRLGAKESKSIARLVQCLSRLVLESRGRTAPKPRRKTITAAGTTCKSRPMLCSLAKTSLPKKS